MYTTSLKLPQEMRRQFKKPWGLLLTKDETSGSPEEQVKELYQLRKPTLLISVGDVCTESLWKVDIHPHVVIVDGITLRGNYTINTKPRIPYEEIIVRNPPTTIMKEAWEAICKAAEQASRQNIYTLITVKGEEDLLTLPAVTCCPKNGAVVYGQPNEGIVWMEVTLELKEKVKQVLAQFEPV